MSALAPGLLVAAPPLGDPNFDRSVVLLAAHNADGAFGWVVNGREVMSMTELLLRAEVKDRQPHVQGSVRAGGPVAPEQVWLLYQSEERLPGLEGQIDVSPGIIASASREVLEFIARGHVPKKLLGLVGYAGWGPSQLENEIRAGAWLPTDVTPQLVFESPAADLWTLAYASLGATPMSFTSRTVGLA